MDNIDNFRHSSGLFYDKNIQYQPPRRSSNSPIRSRSSSPPPQAQIEEASSSQPQTEAGVLRNFGEDFNANLQLLGFSNQNQLTIAADITSTTFGSTQKNRTTTEKTLSYNLLKKIQEAVNKEGDKQYSYENIKHIFSLTHRISPKA